MLGLRGEILQQDPRQVGCVDCRVVFFHSLGTRSILSFGGCEVWCHNVPLTKWKVTVQHDHLSFPGIVIAA